MLLIDNSAWARIVQGSISAQRAEQVRAWIEEEHLATSLPFLLEAGYSARSAAELDAMRADLASLPRIAIGADVEQRALAAQRELAAVGHHRLPPTDLLIAACAEDADGGVLHHDRDYDLIVEHTSLRFASEWLAPAGSL